VKWAADMALLRNEANNFFHICNLRFANSPAFLEELSLNTEDLVPLWGSNKRTSFFSLCQRFF